MAGQVSGCAKQGGCPTDYIAVTIAVQSFLLLLWRTIFPLLIHKVPRFNGSGFWIPVIQIFGSLNFLLSLVMADNFLKFKRRHWLLSCYVWAVWFEGPLGFGLLLSCRITQAFQLYCIFVKKRLPPIRSYILLPLILLPWIAGAVFIHAKQPMNGRCHMGVHWVVPVVCFHSFYVAALLGLTGAIQHIEFKFDELKDLWKAILLSALSIGIWIAAYVNNEVRERVSWIQVTSRFLLLVMSSMLVLAFFSISSSQPLLSQISLRKREPLVFETMGQALGIPDSGLLSMRGPAHPVDPNDPLDKLLLNKRFRQSFMAFADSCLAGESMHFYNEVHDLGKIPVDDTVRRIYMARHIIEKYIIPGAAMEVNISHRTRQEILTTENLADANLFNNALNELMQLMKTNLAKDYWSSMFFIKFKDEASTRANGQELEHMTDWNYSPRLSSVRGLDDPFHQEHFLKDNGRENFGSDRKMNLDNV